MTAQAVAVAVTGTGAVLANPCTLRGFSVVDTSAGANTVKVFDNASAASGTVLATVVLAASGSATVAIPDGVRAAAGLYLQSTGVLQGSVWVG
jgi:hypothetical protein